jgi:hypothetical protein
MKATSCRRMVGEPGQDCRTCGRRIVRIYANSYTEDFALIHVGADSIGAKLADLEQRRRLEAAR